MASTWFYPPFFLVIIFDETCEKLWSPLLQGAEASAPSRKGPAGPWNQSLNVFGCDARCPDVVHKSAHLRKLLRLCTGLGAIPSPFQLCEAGKPLVQRVFGRGFADFGANPSPAWGDGAGTLESPC